MATLPVEPLAGVEKEGILFAREEEKVARDVYTVLGAKWGQRAFTAIAAAEQQHLDAVAFLLTRYELADPAAGKAPGVFANARLQALYVSLVEKGSVSLVEAFVVGAMIEDLDLADVEELLADADNIDIDTVMQNCWLPRYLVAVPGLFRRRRNAGRRPDMATSPLWKPWESHGRATCSAT